MYNKVIEVKELTKTYGKFTALNKLSFDIYDGEIFGLIGPNGAGKSTFISILATVTRPTYGDVFIKNFSVTKNPNSVKKHIGFVPQDIALYPMLSGLDNLNFWAEIYGLKGDIKKQRIKDALEAVRIKEWAKNRVDSYSGGMKRRLNIAVALLHHPKILIMDEPIVGIDIQSRKYILEGIKALKDEGRTVVFASHYIDEMQDLCDRIAIIDKGIIKTAGNVEELKVRYKKEKIEDIMLSIIE